MGGLGITVYDLKSKQALKLERMVTACLGDSD